MGGKKKLPTTHASHHFLFLQITSLFFSHVSLSPFLSNPLFFSFSHVYYIYFLLFKETKEENHDYVLHAMVDEGGIHRRRKVSCKSNSHHCYPAVPLPSSLHFGLKWDRARTSCSSLIWSKCVGQFELEWVRSSLPELRARSRLDWAIQARSSLSVPGSNGGRKELLELDQALRAQTSLSSSIESQYRARTGSLRVF